MSDPSGFLSVVSALPGFRQVQAKFSRQAFRRPFFPVYHPAPASCSVRLLFVSLMVRFSIPLFSFRSVPFVSASFVRSVRFVPFQLNPFIIQFFRFRLFRSFFELKFCVFSSGCACYLYISRVYYTLKTTKIKCIFYQKTCHF